jgi:hypothetical protein
MDAHASNRAAERLPLPGKPIAGYELLRAINDVFKSAGSGARLLPLP